MGLLYAMNKDSVNTRPIDLAIRELGRLLVVCLKDDRQTRAHVDYHLAAKVARYPG